jgi:ADP-ribose pyrophosphatase YjhB (NUDIX family)
LDTFSARLKRQLFWVVSRICFKLYGTFPIFGSLRASIAIIRSGQTFLLIRRNDGRGCSLPGGLAAWREPEESTLRREVREETGLAVTSFELLGRYPSNIEIPCMVSVFSANATGTVEDSWEGSPRWMTIEEVEQCITKSQKFVLEHMKKIGSQADPRQG